MRYPLDTVITGLKHRVAQRPLAREARIKELQDELHAALRGLDAFRAEAARCLAEKADLVASGEYPKKYDLSGYGISQELRRDLDGVAHDLGLISTMERDRKERQLKELRQTRDQPTDVDRVLAFLQLMAKAGETHVSSNGLKQAGYDPHLLADAVLAAAEVADAEPAR